MTPEDMAALHAACFTTPRPWGAQEFAQLLTQPGVFAVARPDGFALGRVIAGETELLTIAVDPSQRRQGAGRALMAAFETEALSRKGEAVFLEVAADNTAAIALYTSCGFADAGRRRGYYRRPDGTTLDALVMTRALSTAER
jgi:ribosomal-protein-alanine N-acetyltransferase